MRNYHYFVFSLLGGVILFLLCLGLGTLWFGGIGQLLAFADGESVYFVPKNLDLGSCKAGTSKVAVFHITNFASKSISIIGQQSSCNCVCSDQIPITALPGKTASLKINIQIPMYESFYDQTITFIVAEPKRLTMHPVRITATIPNPKPLPDENMESTNKETTEGV